MKEIIEALAQKWGINLNKTGYIKLQLKGYEDLCIEAIGGRQVSVMHTFLQNGDVMRDPEIVFFMDLEGWKPLEYTLDALGRYRVCAEVEKGEYKVTDQRQFNGISDLARMWVENLKEQGWLENAAVVYQGE